MKKLYILILAGSLSFSIFSQSNVVDFEDLNLPIDSFWNGSTQTGQFVSNSTTFSNVYDTSFGGFWSGFSYSTMRNDSTPGFTNQYSCISGLGHNSSATYAVYYNNAMDLVTIPNHGRVTGFWINNSTYSYLSMKNGDFFSKKFGDSTNASGVVDGTNGNDFLKLTIYGTNSDSVEFYLADYRGSSANDYIIENWTYVDLTTINPNSKSLKFKLTSSDNNSFGMVTPAYFCLDNLAYSTSVSIEENSPKSISVFPNPTQNIVNIQFEETVSNATYRIMDVTGREITNATINGVSNLTIDLTSQNNGIYFFMMSIDSETITKRIIKQ